MEQVKILPRVLLVCMCMISFYNMVQCATVILGSIMLKQDENLPQNKTLLRSYNYTVCLSISSGMSTFGKECSLIVVDGSNRNRIKSSWGPRQMSDICQLKVDDYGPEGVVYLAAEEHDQDVVVLKLSPYQNAHRNTLFLGIDKDGNLYVANPERINLTTSRAPSSRFPVLAALLCCARLFF